MAKRGHTQEEILRVLREAESGWRSAASTALASSRSIRGGRSTPALG